MVCPVAYDPFDVGTEFITNSSPFGINPKASSYRGKHTVAASNCSVIRFAPKTALTVSPSLGIAETFSNSMIQSKFANSHSLAIRFAPKTALTVAPSLGIAETFSNSKKQDKFANSHSLAIRFASKIALTAAPSSLGIAETFSKLKKQGKVAFIPNATAGDPDLSTTAEALKELDSCGSDIIELGVPYSDPLADGPVIWSSNFDAITAMLEEVVSRLSGSVALLNAEPSLKAEKAYMGDPISMEYDIPNNDPHLVQWDNLFYGRCYIEDKLCSVLIDGGSSMNLIAKDLSTYLNLRLVRLQNPVRLNGIYGDGGKVITHVTWVTFSVADYVGTHQFLVVPNSTTEVLLGRPWISLEDAIHYGRANVYDIKKKGMTIRLNPLTHRHARSYRGIVEPNPN